MVDVTITYNAPPGDQPYCETRGVKFFDGQPRSLDVEQHAELIAKCETNPHFTVDGDRRKVLAALKPEFVTAGEQVGTDDNYRSELLAEAESLGVKVDGRWSDRRLETEISKAKIEAAG